MIVHCEECNLNYDDEFRLTYCPHETFLANDGKNNFSHHRDSYRSPMGPMIDTSELSGLSVRARNVLLGMGVTTLAQLRTVTVYSILSARNAGPVTANEIVEFLRRKI